MWLIGSTLLVAANTDGSPDDFVYDTFYAADLTAETPELTARSFHSGTARYLVSDGASLYVKSENALWVYNSELTLEKGDITHSTALSSENIFVAENGKVYIFASKYGERQYYIYDIELNEATKIEGGFVPYAAANASGGVFVSNECEFKMSGGEIVGNTCTDSGGGGVFVIGKFTMAGGEITGNTVSSVGAGVYAFGGDFVMSAGKIINNNGYGVYQSSGECTMTGGEISGNTGGGIYLGLNVPFTVSGNPIITGNTKGGAPHNVYLYGSGVSMRMCQIIIGEGGLEGDAQIGVTTGITPTTGSPVTFATAASNDYSDYFSSDNDSYSVTYNDSEKVLQLTANPHVHDDSSGTETTFQTIGSGDFNALNGDYYLDKDVSVSSDITITGTVNLCLNGHVLNLNYKNIVVEETATLNICDCDTTTEHHFTVGDTGKWTLTGNNGTDPGDTALKGGVITNGTAYSFLSDNGGAILVDGGTLNLYAGSIVGNMANGTYGGGVYVSGGSFNMYGGSIVGNAATGRSGSGGIGGGVYVAGGSFTMEGGEITGNTSASYGGGVYVGGGSFNMEGGKITGNTSASIGGGVYVASDASASFTVSGTPTIADNTANDSTENVYLSDDGTIIIGGALTGGSVGVTTAITPTSSSPVTFTSGWSTHMSTAQPTTYFFPDSDQYKVTLSAAGEVQLGKKPSPLPGDKDLTDYVDISPQPVNGWYKDDITLRGEGGYTIGTSDSMFGTDVTIDEETGSGKLIVYIKDENGDIYQAEFEYKLDKTPPQQPVISGGSPSGEELTITVTATDGDGSTGSGIAGVTVKKDSGSEQPVTGGTTTITEAGTYTFTATDEAGNTSEKIITVHSVTVGEDEQLVVSGGKITRPSDPAGEPGYTFAGWFNGDKKWDFDEDTVTGDITLIPKWTQGEEPEPEPETYTIAASAGAGGSIAPSGSVNVEKGKDQAFTITPSEGYEIADVVVDGISVTVTDNSYTFADVQTDHTIAVAFRETSEEPEPETYTVTLYNGGEGAFGSGSYAAGEEVTIYAGQQADSEFIGWQCWGAKLQNPDSAYTTFTMPKNAVEVWARWYTESGSSSSGGGGVTLPSHDISVDGSSHGDVEIWPEEAKMTTTVTVTVTPDEGYELGSLIVTDENGNELELTDKGDGVFTFRMPNGGVSVEAEFVAIQPDYTDCDGGWTCPILPFIDASTTAWYHDGVHYCLENGLMNGTGANTFSPDGATSRAMIATILWRLSGSPAAAAAQPFTDVVAGSWYAEAVNWAAGEGIVTGYDGGIFAPDKAITREELAAMLYRYAQSLELTVTAPERLSGYPDRDSVQSYAVEAANWAVYYGIINGKDGSSRSDHGPEFRSLCEVGKRGNGGRTQYHLPRHSDKGVDERVCKGRPEGGIAQHGRIV